MLKKYFWLTLLFILIEVSLVFLGWQGFLPFSGLLAFGIFSLFLIGLAFFYPREFFWFFLASLPLENVFLTPANFPLSLRLYQLLGVSLFLALIFRKVIKQEKFKLNLFFWRKSAENKGISWFDVAVFSWLVTFSLGFAGGASSQENLKWFLILGSFVFLFWLARNFLVTEKEKAEGLFFFLIGGGTVWLVGFYQALAMKLGWESFAVMEGRVNASFLEPDWLGIYWAFFLGLMLGLKIFFASWENGQKLFLGKMKLKFALGKILNLKIFSLGVMLALTVSRSAWLAMGAVLLAYGFFLWQGSGEKTFTLNNFWQSCRETFSVSLFLLAGFVVVAWSGLSNFDFLNRAGSTFSGQQKITISCREDSFLPEEIASVDDLLSWGCRHINLEEIEREKQAGFFVKEINRPDPNVNIRKGIYGTVWQAIKTQPWLGQGWAAAGRILGQDENGNGLNASNIFLEIWLSAGLLGLLSFLGVWVLVGKTIFQMAFSVQGFFLLSGLAFLVANLFNAGLFLGFFWIWLAFLGDYSNFNKKI